MRKTARAIILDENKRILVFERNRRDGIFGKSHHYYSIPGGGVEEGETPEQAVIRELSEEMLIDIAPQKLIIHQLDPANQREHFYYLARIISGTPTFNTSSEEAANAALKGKDIFLIAWVELDDPLLAYHESYGQVARQIKEWLASSDFPTEAVDMTVKSR